MSLGNLKSRLDDLTFSSTDVERQVREAKNSLKIRESFKTDLKGFDLVNKPIDNDGELPGLAPVEVVSNVGLAVQNITERAADLVTRLSGADQTDLNNIVGDSRLTAPGNLTVAASAPFPEALAKTLQATTTAAKAEIETIVQKNNFAIADDINKIVGNVFNSNLSISAQLRGTISSIGSETSRFLDSVDKGFEGLLDNLVEDLLGSIKGKFTQLATINDIATNLPDFVQRQIVGEIDKGNFAQAASLLVPFSDSTRSTIESNLRNVKTKASDTLKPLDDTATVDVKITNITKLSNLFNDSKDVIPPEVFANIGKYAFEINALQREIANLKREVTEVIIYPLIDVRKTKKPITIEDLQRLSRKFNNTSYACHFYLKPNGILQRGRPMEIESPAVGGLLSTKNHHKRSIIIQPYMSTTELTPSSFNTLALFIKMITEVMPGILILQYAEITNRKSVPPLELNGIFSALPNYVKLDREIYDPKEKEPLTVKELAVYLNSENEDVGPIK